MWIRKLKAVSAGVAVLSLVACGTTGTSSDNAFKSEPRGEASAILDNPASSNLSNNPSNMPGDKLNMPNATPSSGTMDNNAPATQPAAGGAQ